MHTAIKVENHTYLVRDSGPWPAEKRKSGCYCSQPKLNIRLLWVVGNLDCTKPRWNIRLVWVVGNLDCTKLRWNIRLVWVVGNLDCTKSQWNIRLVLVVGNFDCTKPRWNTQARARVSAHSITWFDSISNEFTLYSLDTTPHGKIARRPLQQIIVFFMRNWLFDNLQNIHRAKHERGLPEI
jgi:hypothetical protein